VGTFEVTIAVGDPAGTRFEDVPALADTGATFTTIPGSILQRLGVLPREKVRFRLADNRSVELDIGETIVRVDGRLVTTTVVFGDDEALALLGAYTLERALLAADPVQRRLVPTEALLMPMR
jgi:clan AA aspartic protease